MACRSTSRTSDELLAPIGKLYWHVPTLVWNAHVPSGDLLFHGVLRQRGARVRQVHGIRQLFGASHLASSFHPRFPLHSRIILFCRLSSYGHVRNASDGNPGYLRLSTEAIGALTFIGREIDLPCRRSALLQGEDTPPVLVEDCSGRYSSCTSGFPYASRQALDGLDPERRSSHGLVRALEANPCLRLRESRTPESSRNLAGTRQFESDQRHSHVYTQSLPACE